MKNTDLEQIHVLIVGLVQGVGFRYSTQQQAKIIGVSGWVRNTNEGSVEAVAEGTPEQIIQFLKWCGQGPRSAKVDEVKVLKRSRITSPSHSTFDHR